MFRATFLSLPICLLLFLTFPHVLTAGEPIESRLLNEWKDPTFIKAFTGDLGIRTDIEPSITAEEKTLISGILTQITQNPAQALSSLSAKVTDQSSAALDFLLGHLSNVLGNRQAAAEHYRAATAKFPNFLRAHKWLGHFYFEQQDFVRATESYGRVLTLSQGDEFVHGRLAYCLMNREEYVSAETAFRAATVANPKNPRWKSGLAHCFLNQELPESALVIIDEVLSQEPGIQSHWLLKANAHLATHQPRQALAALEAARRLGRPTAEILISIGDLYLNEGLVQAAVSNYQSALSENPDAAETGALRAIENLLIRDHLPESEQLMKTYTELSSAKPSKKQQDRQEKLRLWIKLTKSPSKEAVTEMESYLESHPLDIDSLTRLAEHYQASNELKKAERLFLQALRIDDSRVPILIEIAQLQAEQRRYTEALSYIQRALRLGPDSNLESYAQQLEALTQ